MSTAQDQQSRAEFEALHAKRFAQPLTRWGVTYENAHVRCRWEGWQAARALPAPENVREGEPYDNPAFEDMARTMGVWGTAQAALCAQFFLAGRASPAVDKSPDMQGQAVDKGDDLQGCAPADQWKCGNEFLPYHPSASHVEPAYRDGWNACFKGAAHVLAMGRVPPGWQAVPGKPSSAMVEAGVEDLRRRGYEHALIVGAVEVWRAMCAAAPRPPAAPKVPTEDTPSYLAQMFGPGPAPRPPAAQEGA